MLFRKERIDAPIETNGRVPILILLSVFIVVCHKRLGLLSVLVTLLAFFFATRQGKNGGCRHGLLKSGGETCMAFACKRYFSAVFSVHGVTKFATSRIMQRRFNARRLNASCH